MSLYAYSLAQGFFYGSAIGALRCWSAEWHFKILSWAVKLLSSIAISAGANSYRSPVRANNYTEFPPCKGIVFV